MKRRFLKRRVLNTIHWTTTVIAVCMLLMSDIEWQKIAGVYVFFNMMIKTFFDKKFNEMNGFI